MTIYYVGDKEFLSLTAAKEEMKRTGKHGEKVKVWGNGDWDHCGEIKLEGSNRIRIRGARSSNSY